MIRRATRVPGVWHGLAPVIAELLLLLRNIHLNPPPPHPLPLMAKPRQRERERERETERDRETERERERWGDSQTDRKRESRQRPCERVSYGTDLVLMTPTTPHHLPPALCPPSATHSSNPHPTSLRPGRYHPFIRNAGLYRLQCPVALPIRAPVHPSGHILPELTPDTRHSDSSPT